MDQALATLIAAAGRRDADAIATLVHRFQPWALDLAAALLHDTHLAEDAVQSAFVAALTHLADLRDPQAFPAWFKQIVRTECGRLTRRSAARPAPAAESADDAPPRPAEAAALAELRAQVREALAALTPATRDAAERFYLHQLDLATIAAELDVPTGTVKRRLHDARRQLRTRLADYAPDDRDRQMPL